MENKTTRNILPNGLTVILERNTNAKIVSIYLGVKVGSANETNSEAGLCHLIEHMVFKGTRSFGMGQIASLVESHGGELNAYTSFDQTVYYINLPKSHLALGLKIIKEMVFDATIDPAELAREKEVVIEEIRRGKDNPQSVLCDALFKHSYGSHNYGRPIIGSMETVRSFSPQKVKEFYTHHYCAANMVLGLCGHIKTKKALGVTQEIFGVLPRQKMLTTQIRQPNIHKKASLVTLDMNIAATYFDVAFPIPRITHEDVPALDVLSHLLGESDTSLLEQNTKEKEQLVHSISSSSYTPKQPGLFLIGGLVDPHKLNQALHSIFRQVDRIKTHLIEDEKIERTKLLAKAQVIYEKQTCEGTARKWISYETTAGNYRFDERYLRAVARLTTAEIQKAARKYLDLSRATCVVLHPQTARVSLRRSLFENGRHRRANRFEKIESGFGTNVFRLPNGIRVILKENARLPLISLKSASFGGLRYETDKNNGISTLIANVITKGTQNISQLTFAEKCEWLAGGISGYSGRNSFGLSCSFLSEKTEQAIPLFADVLINPAFDPKEVVKEKKLQLEAIKNRGDQLAQASLRLVMKHLYRGHPYRNHLLGEKKSVKQMTDLQLRDHYQALIVPDNLVLSCVGDFKTDDMLGQLEDVLGGLKPLPFKPVTASVPHAPAHKVRLLEYKKKHQAHISLGFLGCSLNNDDRHVLEIIHSVLSGQGGRLFLNLRDKQSLAYTVTSSTIQGIETGYFGLYIATDPHKIDQAISGLEREIQLLQQTPISIDELKRAQNYLIGNHEIDHQKNSAIAQQLAMGELYQKGLKEFFEFQKTVCQVTRQDIQRVARKYLRLDACVMGIVGPKH